MWKSGDIIAWRGVYRKRIWHAIPTLVIKDTSEEIILSILPGAVCMIEENYAKGKKNGKRRWDFTIEDWNLEKFEWHTNRVLVIAEPGKFYSIMHFWRQATNEFLGYYINFQQPFVRSHCGIDAIDLDLDLDINPDMTFNWKDEDDYKKALEHGLVPPEWEHGIENAKVEILERLKKRRYPFEGTWLNWKVEQTPPCLPENWNEI